MESKKLQESLATIHDELAARQEIDDETRTLLTALGQDIARLLDLQSEQERNDTERSVLAERMRQAVGEFEADHPRLTEALARLADTLSGMGI
ncbi:MAG: DUF4404 family protein [Deltaproteobacteria bacterium]|nr:MAG: DUF4404 family protein [Deltaproteobacteria bacterium]